MYRICDKGPAPENQTQLMLEHGSLRDSDLCSVSALPEPGQKL